jgi:hypothetical protein
MKTHPNGDSPGKVLPYLSFFLSLDRKIEERK